MLSAAAGVPVAENVAAERPVGVAVNVFCPACVPNVQLPSAAWPVLPVFRVPPVRPPPPDATLNVTVTLSTGLPNWSVTRTVGATGTALFTVMDWLSPAVLVTVAGAPATPVAANVTGVTPDALACNAFGPAPVPRVQLVTRARPVASVETGVAGATLPPPPVTANVTPTEGTALPYWSRIRTVGCTATVAFTVAVCASPESIAIVEGDPTVTASVTLIALPVALGAPRKTVAVYVLTARPAVVAVSVSVSGPPVAIAPCSHPVAPGP